MNDQTQTDLLNSLIKIDEGLPAAEGGDIAHLQGVFFTAIQLSLIPDTRALMDDPELKKLYAKARVTEGNPTSEMNAARLAYAKKLREAIHKEMGI